MKPGSRTLEAPEAVDNHVDNVDTLQSIRELDASARRGSLDKHMNLLDFCGESGEKPMIALCGQMLWATGRGRSGC